MSEILSQPGSAADADAATPKSAAIKPDHAFNLKVSSAHVSALEDPKYNYRIGHIVTRHGIVGLYDQPDPSYTRLDFTAGGRNYAATWVRTFSDRYLGTLATRFAASVLDGAGLGPCVHAPPSDDANGLPQEPSQ